jgi:hypothetical protein
VTRSRLRAAYDEAALADLYRIPHDHTRWPVHKVRVVLTAQMARVLTSSARSGADLSCGDGTVLRALDLPRAYYGDIAPGYELTGPIERTVEQIPDVDLFICCETVEHLDDPDTVVKAIRSKAQHLVLSTPVDAWQDSNTEHYWAWDRPAVEEMLRGAGWDPQVYCETDFRPCGGVYSFGIWWCR